LADYLSNAGKRTQESRLKIYEMDNQIDPSINLRNGSKEQHLNEAIANIERDLKSIDDIITHLENVLQSTLTTINKNAQGKA